jgi:hypothetical protein
VEVAELAPDEMKPPATQMNGMTTPIPNGMDLLLLHGLLQFFQHRLHVGLVQLPRRFRNTHENKKTARIPSGFVISSQLLNTSQNIPK